MAGTEEPRPFRVVIWPEREREVLLGLGAFLFAGLAAALAVSVDSSWERVALAAGAAFMLLVAIQRLADLLSGLPLLEADPHGVRLPSLGAFVPWDGIESLRFFHLHMPGFPVKFRLLSVEVRPGGSVTWDRFTLGRAFDFLNRVFRQPPLTVPVSEMHMRESAVVEALRAVSPVPVEVE